MVNRRPRPSDRHARRASTRDLNPHPISPTAGRPAASQRAQAEVLIDGAGRSERELPVNICMVGAGYVGLVSAACFTEFGLDVVCVDKDATRVAALQAGGVPIYEPGLDDLLARNVKAGRLTFTSEIGPAAAAADLIFLAVGTPMRRGDGYADLSFIHAAVEELAPHLQGFTVIATKSTVPVGTSREIERRLRAAPDFTTSFPKGDFGRQLAQAAALIAAGAAISVLKLQHSGYDTHAQQEGRHAALLGTLAEGLAAFRQALLEAGAWQRTLVATYAEFGRRVAENASGGSDHGAAAPHFLLGGRLRGGFLGEQPSLDDLEGGDLRYRLDLRRLYAGLAGEWLGLPPAPASLGRHKALALLT